MATTELDSLLYGQEDDSDRLSTGRDGLMGTWEVARYLGIEKSRIARWLEDLAGGKRTIEPPHARTKSGPHWKFAQVRRKAKQMFEQQHHRPPHSDKELDEWLADRRRWRAKREGRPRVAA